MHNEDGDLELLEFGQQLCGRGESASLNGSFKILWQIISLIQLILEHGVIMPKLPFNMLVELQLLADGFEMSVHPQAILVIHGDNIAELKSCLRDALSQIGLHAEALVQLTLDE